MLAEVRDELVLAVLLGKLNASRVVAAVVVSGVLVLSPVAWIMRCLSPPASWRDEAQCLALKEHRLPI